MKRLQPLGYDGTTRTLQRAIRGGRQAQGLPPIRIKVRQPLPKIADPPSPPLTPRKAAYRIVTRPENRPSEEAARLETGVPQHPELALIVERADAFLELLRQKQADSLDGWITKALTSSVKAFETFAKGILDDYLAVKATLT